MKLQSILQSVLVALAIAATPLAAQSTGPILSYSATTANITGAGDTIRIDLFRWSAEAEGKQLATAWENKPAAPARAPGSARAGRVAEPGPGAVSTITPEVSLTTALQRTGTVGYLWSSETAGYAIRYAAKLKAPDNTERVILITDRRLGKRSGQWSPLTGTPSDADFSVIELRLNAQGLGEGRVSLVGKLTADSAAKVPVPESYNTLPVVLKNVKRQANQTPNGAK